MTLSDAMILQVLHRAFDRAIDFPVDPTMRIGRQNARRSQNWVTCLRNEFNSAYQLAGHPDIRAFCKGCSDNKGEFGLNELLHDVCVCRVATVSSRLHQRPLAYVKDVLWQVESEFEKSGTATIKDFNKLTLGSARQKLFVGPITSSPEGDLATLVQPAKCCSGDIYVAFVEHPDSWLSSPKRPRLYRFLMQEQEWRSIQTPSPELD